jgi:hypothetical protein
VRRSSVAGLAVCLLGSGVAIVGWAQVYPGPLVALVAGVSGLALTAWVLGDSQALRHAYYTSLEERAPGWKPSVTRRHGSPLPQSAAANCRKDAPARSTSPPHQRRDRQHAVHSPGVVEKHVASVFAKLGLAPSDNDNRRVIAASHTWNLDPG